MNVKTVVPDRDSHYKLLPCNCCESMDVAYKVVEPGLGCRAVCLTCGTETKIYNALHDAQAEWNANYRASRPAKSWPFAQRGDFA